MSETNFENEGNVDKTLKSIYGLALDPAFLPPMPDVGLLLTMTGMQIFGSADNNPELIA